MLYMLMCCINEDRWNNIPSPRRDKIMQEYGLVMEQTKRSGQHRGGAMLSPSTAATSIRLQNGKPMITDGPFAETKEQLGGYHLIECENLDEAISIAMRIPTIPEGGVIEIRPVELMESE
ncbi:YciI family protein [bacterium]|nr:YciI family protein [bacterium]